MMPKVHFEIGIKQSIDTYTLVWAMNYLYVHHQVPYGKVTKKKLIEFLRNQMAQFGNADEFLYGTNYSEDDIDPDDMERIQKRLMYLFCKG
jgi:hypothetical protein